MDQAFVISCDHSILFLFVERHFFVPLIHTSVFLWLWGQSNLYESMSVTPSLTVRAWQSQLKAQTHWKRLRRASDTFEFHKLFSTVEHALKAFRCSSIFPNAPTPTLFRFLEHQIRTQRAKAVIF